MRKVLGVLVMVSAAGGPASALAQAAEETIQGILAAQIRTQGFACDKPLGATRDAKRSRPDYAVWVLKCSNAAYRVGRFPDVAAKVQPLE
jgi:hypothetical protein